jgi:hypothetical protein
VFDTVQLDQGRSDPDQCWPLTDANAGWQAYVEMKAILAPVHAADTGPWVMARGSGRAPAADQGDVRQEVPCPVPGQRTG